MSTDTASGLGAWLRQRGANLAARAADNLLWLVLLAVIGGGATFLASVREQAAAHRTLALVLAAAFLGVGVALSVVGVIAVLVDKKRQRDARTAFLERETLLAEAERELIYNALESVQYAIASTEAWDLEALVERGILGPVRGLLVRSDFEDVRIAILIPDNDHFVMRWAAGHRPESVKKFRRPIDSMLAGIAYTTGDFYVCPNINDEPRFIPNPKATRDFTTIVAIPLRLEEQLVGVLGVVSTLEDAFSESDISFIKVVGALLDVILATEWDAGQFEKEIEAAEQRGRDGADPAKP